jgi:hypothetical protein
MVGLVYNVIGATWLTGTSSHHDGRHLRVMCNIHPELNVQQLKTNEGMRHDTGAMGGVGPGGEKAAPPQQSGAAGGNSARGLAPEPPPEPKKLEIKGIAKDVCK